MTGTEQAYVNDNVDNNKNVAYAVNNNLMDVSGLHDDFNPFWINPKTTEKLGGVEQVESMLTPEKLEEWRKKTGVDDTPTVEQLRKYEAKVEAKKAEVIEDSGDESEETKKKDG